MASSTTASKVLCVVCNKGKGSFKCEGCSQTFCPKHSYDHRNELSQQLGDIEVSHDLIHRTLIEQTEDPQQHPLLKKVDEWEQTAIVKIRQTAKEIRNELLKNTAEQTANIKQKLKQLSDELRQGREDNDFIETDLRQWTHKLEELKKELLNPKTITIQEDSTSLITKIRIDRHDLSDVFERVSGTAQIKENGCLVVKDSSAKHTEVRGRGEYSTGRHTFRFRVEQLVQNGWILFGTISKSEPMKLNSHCSSSTYGWSNQNQTYGVTQHSSRSNDDIIQNDTVILLINCDQRKIELKNERTNSTLEMSVDINKCPFPWQLHLNLHAANTHVRILNPSD
jgi:hypothetical protein